MPAVRMVVNPVAGRRNAQRELTRVVRRLRETGLAVEVERTRGPGDAAAWSAGLDDATTQAVVVVGGDGTIREVIDGLAGRAVPIAILPTGTENLVAKQFGFRFDAESLCRRIRTGVPTCVDVGELNGRLFLVVAGAGFDAEVVERLRASRTGHITHLSYFWPIWRTFWEHRFEPIRVLADGETIFDGPALVFVGNLPRYAIGLPIYPDARYDDGLLDVVIYPCRGRGRLLLHAVNTIFKRHYRRGGAIHHRCRKLQLTSTHRIPIEADGDCAGELPVDITVHPAGATFLLAPQDPVG